jgi:hypothetical protein
MAMRKIPKPNSAATSPTPRAPDESWPFKSAGPWSVAPDAEREKAVDSPGRAHNRPREVENEKFFYFFPRNPLKSPDSTK